jgi:hypothetical protein
VKPSGFTVRAAFKAADISETCDGAEVIRLILFITSAPINLFKSGVEAIVEAIELISLLSSKFFIFNF